MNEILFAYSRKQAIADGVLRDVSALAGEAGFRFPVAVTAAVWADDVTVPDVCPWLDETGRLWDVLNMLRYAVRTASDKCLICFEVLVQNDERGPKLVTLKAVCSPGDDAEPVITVMLADED